MAIYAIGAHRPTIHDTAYVTESASVMGKVERKADSSVWFGAVLRGDN